MSDELSNFGRQRREAILRDAQLFARRRGRRRIATRATAAAALCVTLIAGVGSLIGRSPGDREKTASPLVIITPGHRDVSPPSVVARVTHRPAFEIVHIQTDPTIVDRLSVKMAPPIARLDDDALLAALAAAGRPAALVYSNGRPRLVELN